MTEEALYDDETGAGLYDIAFGWQRSREADFTEACAEAFGGLGDGRLLDLACGGGHFLHEMQQRGWQVAGVDLSPTMISRAQQRLAGDCTLQVADMRDFTLPVAADMATCWLDSFTYLLSNEDLIQHLRSVARALRDRGLYLVDLDFGHWAHPMWRPAQADGEPDLSQDWSWSTSRGDLEVYHEGGYGPPCDRMAHVCTEHLHFRVTDRASGEVTRHTYETPKRTLHPQEFAALVTASEAFDIVGWFTDRMDLADRFDGAVDQVRALVLLRSTLGTRPE